jgi:gamma-glutamylaminecyclotransferase
MSRPEEAASTWDVFVYGTLRRGFCNHFYLDKARFLGPATTRDGHAMYLYGGIPYLLRRASGPRIVGELYRMDAGILAGLDRLEEHPRVYRRELAPVILADGREGAAWIYFALAAHGVGAGTGDFAAVAGPEVLSKF